MQIFSISGICATEIWFINVNELSGKDTQTRSLLPSLFSLLLQEVGNKKFNWWFILEPQAAVAQYSQFCRSGPWIVTFSPKVGVRPWENLAHGAQTQEDLCQESHLRMIFYVK